MASERLARVLADVDARLALLMGPKHPVRVEIAKVLSMSTVTKDTPRRCHLELLAPVELLLRDALLAIEAMPADERLTEASLFLMHAQSKVADYIDEHPPQPF